MRNYGVLKGKAIGYKRDNDDTPHSELLMSARGVMFRASINVRSSRGLRHQRLIEHLIVHDFHHPVLEDARSLPMGWNDLTDGIEDGAAIDYIRSNLFRPMDMKPITHLAPGPDNDLFEYVEKLLQRAINDESAVVYAFGERWGPEHGKADHSFDFTPGNGVHLIHMNQGGKNDNHGTFRDGALLIEFQRSQSAVALFLKFQNQSTHTSNTDAVRIDGAPTVPEISIPDTGSIAPWQVLPEDSPYYLARIVAAMVNPRGEDSGREFVTIVNASDQTLNMNGWKILDRNGKEEEISTTVFPGEAISVRLSGQGAQLSNKGGTITLLDPRGLKVDGVAYTKGQAKIQGKPILFI